MTKPYILLAAGHNSVGDPGNPVERALTDDLARAYKSAFRGAGFSCDILQEIDGDSLPMSTTGGLSRVASLCGTILLNRPEKYSVLLDLHFDGSSSPVHVVVPHVRKDNGGLLTSGFSGGSPANDVIENNTRDADLAEAIAKNIVADVPNMRLHGAKGIMLETVTNVGGQGFRLGMFGGSAKARHKAVRLVIEHGGTNDAAKPDFFNKCAKASLRAVNQVFADVIGVPDVPDIPDVPPITPEPTPVMEYAPGMNKAVASRMFGLMSADGVDYSFNDSLQGVVSNLWNDYGKETGHYPKLIDVFKVGTAKYFHFASGLVIWTPKDGVDPMRVMEGVTP